MKIRVLSAIAFGLALSAGILAQAPPAQAPQSSGQPSGDGQGRPHGDRGGWMGSASVGRGILGVVTEAAADHYTIKTDTGETYTVHFSVNTRIMKAPSGPRPQNGRGDGDAAQRPQLEALKPTEIKVGDSITAAGDVDAAAKSVGAVFILQLDPERAKQMREMQANYGKTWLMGKVTAIDGVKVTLLGGVDNAAHSFVADENTTFRKRRDPITLGDIAVGDNLRVEGAIKDGVFVAASVNAMGGPRADAGQQPGTPTSAPAPTAGK
jgi:hypothetical protein